MARRKVDWSRFPKGHDYSPSKVKTYRMCPKRLWYQVVLKLYDPAGPAAEVGTVYHSVMEMAAKARIKGTADLPDVAGIEELAGYHAKAAAGMSPWVVAQSLAKVEAGAPMDFVNIHQSEQPIVCLTGRWKFGGILDRVDVQEGEDGFVYVRITDYKTGYIPDYEEFLEDPQVVLYAKWAWETFSAIYSPDALVLQVAFAWPTVEFALEATWSDGWLVAGSRQVEVAAQLRVIESEVDDFKGWSKDKVGHANVGSVHCSHCPYRDQCAEYQDHIRKPARIHPWKHLLDQAVERDKDAVVAFLEGGGPEHAKGQFLREAVGELLAYRYQWAADAKLLEGARKEVDRLLIDGKHVVTKGQGERFDDGAHEAYVRRDATSSYPISVVEHMAKVAGVDLGKAIRMLCTVSGSKVKAFVTKYPAAEGVASAYKTEGMKAPWIRVKAHGGMF